MKYQSLIKDSSVYTGSVVIATFCAMIQNIMVARFLGPEMYGILHIYRLVITYAMHAGLGILWALLREIPFYRGEGSHEKIEEIKSVTFSSNFLLSAAAAVIVFVAALIMNRGSNIAIREVSIVAVIIMAEHMLYFLEHYLLAQKKFTIRSKVKLVYSITNLTGVCILGYYLKLPGVLIAMLIAYLLGIAYAWKAIRFKPHIAFNGKETARLIKIGLPILGNGVTTHLMGTVNKFMIIGFMERVQLGYFGLASMIKQFMGILYMSVFMTIFPSLAERYGKAKTLKSIKNYVLKPIFVSSYLSPLFLGSIAIAVPMVIKYILPQYASVVLLTQISVISFFFACTYAGIPNFLITIKKINSIYPFRIFAIILSTVLVYFAIKTGQGLLGIAVCGMITGFLFSVSLVNHLLKYYTIGRTARIKHFIYIYIPFVYMLICLWLVHLVDVPFGSVLTRDLVTVAVRLALFFVMNIPLILYIDRKTSVLKEIRIFLVEFYRTKILRVAG